MNNSVARRIYYALKPYLPWALRLWARRRIAEKRRAVSGDIWPIKESTGRAPEGWPGWPDGKKFAFVLTHDVERQGGVDKCEALADLEESHGFRSSFNFIPLGDYRVSRELREKLARRGFEIGVHDLHHDGHLYDSREGFMEKAAKINEVLRGWGAVGFRSGFMLHNLDWIGHLNIKYDASTFDVDPFEPQPDGADTIFPLWIDGANGGYVELPYTLTQDSTMFLFLQEKTIDIWKRKVDWVAQKGGMVLLNLHPDYVCFDGNLSSSEFPATLYKDLLVYVSQKYAGQYWHALPRDVADFAARALRPECRKEAVLTR